MIERLLLVAALAGAGGWWLGYQLASASHAKQLKDVQDKAARDKSAADKRADDAAAALERLRSQRAPLIEAAKEQGHHALNASRDWADSPLPAGVRDAAAAIVRATRDPGEPAPAVPGATGRGAGDE